MAQVFESFTFEDGLKWMLRYINDNQSDKQISIDDAWNWFEPILMALGMTHPLTRKVTRELFNDSIRHKSK